jgi:outer membrane lipoprotein-sorting protein
LPHGFAVGRTSLDSVHSWPALNGWPLACGTIAPTQVFRRGRGGFFGKILKLDAAVTSSSTVRRLSSPSLPESAAGWRLALGVIVASASMSVAAQAQPAASVYSRRPAPALVTTAPAAARPDAAAVAAAADSPQAERIVAGALAVLTRADSFSARMRQKVRIGDRVLVGAGRYVQAGQGGERRFRFESMLKCDTESFEQLEVCDGLFCWTYRRNGPESASLQRVDVRRVIDQLTQLKAPEGTDPAPYLGGLQRILWLLRESFRFTSAAAAEFDGASVWVVNGQWEPGRLAALIPDLKDAAGQPEGVSAESLPDGMPWRIRLAIGRNDLVLRRVEWLGIPGLRPVAAGAAVEPIAVLDIDEPQLGGPIDAAAFFYQPATTGLMDVTEQHVKSLSLMRP